jgi:large subunit ribosomal protein L21
MYAIVKAGGTQFKVAPLDVVRIPKSAHLEGAEVKLGEVLLIRSRDTILVGRPLVAGAEVNAKVLRHGRYRKVRGFKFKKRKKYRRTWGAREAYTEVVITGITAPGIKPEVEDKAAEAVQDKKALPKKAPEKKPEAKPKSKPKAKKAAETAQKK